MTITIIIPIYNVVPYIERCIRSVLEQTYRDLEVFLVDDCSLDNSMIIAKKVIDESGVQDMKFVYLKHEHNRGLSAARNTGIDAATGEYVFFLDSDDEILPVCIEKLAEPLKIKSFDFVIGNYELRGLDASLPSLSLLGVDNNPRQSYSKGEWYPMAWNKLVNLQFLKKHKLYFKEGLIHEDELWSFQLAYSAKSLYAVQDNTYLYFIRENSITTAESRKNRIETCIKISYLMWDFIDNRGLAKDIAANNHIDKFIDSKCCFFCLEPRSEGYYYYKLFRKNTERKKNVFWYLSFSSISGFMKYSHYLMPIPLAFGLKRIIRSIRKTP